MIPPKPGCPAHAPNRHYPFRVPVFAAAFAPDLAAGSSLASSLESSPLAEVAGQNGRLNATLQTQSSSSNSSNNDETTKPPRRPSTIRRPAGKIRIGRPANHHKLPLVSLRVHPHKWEEWGYYARPLVMVLVSMISFPQ